MTGWQQDDTIAALMLKTAIEAVEAAEMYYGATLDGTPASIAILEQKVQDVARSERESMVYFWGAYIGEVFRRDVGGHWGVWHEASSRTKAFNCRGVTIFPHDKLHKRLASGAEHDLRDYYQTFRAQMLRR